MIAPYGTQYVVYSVKVDKGAPHNTIITSQAQLMDDALGDTDTVNITVK
jgi:hypothetical protein